MPPGTPERFGLHDDAFRAASSRERRRFAARLGVTALIVAGVWAVALRPQGSGPRTLVFSLALLGALAAVTFARRMRRLHARLRSFSLTLEPDAVSRFVEGYAPVRIARAEVASIAEGPRGLVVRDGAGRTLVVPRETDGYERVRVALASWAPIRG